MDPYFQPPLLQNELLQLTLLQPEDFDALYRVASDPLLWEQHPEKDRYQRQVFSAFFEQALQAGAFLIREAQTGKVVGSSRFYDYDPAQKSVLVGYTFIDRSLWGGHYNTSLKKLMLGYAFEKVEKIYFHIGAFNYRSQKAVEKIGGIKTGEFQTQHGEGTTKLNYIYQLDKKDFRL